MFPADSALIISPVSNSIHREFLAVFRVPCVKLVINLLFSLLQTWADITGLQIIIIQPVIAQMIRAGNLPPKGTTIRDLQLTR